MSDDSLDEVRRLIPEPVDVPGVTTQPSLELVVPGIGELVKLDEPGQVARAIDSIRDLERRLKEVKSELTDALVYSSRMEGSKTLRFEGGKATIAGGETTQYDAEAIMEGLAAAGMSVERLQEVVKETVTYTVVAGEAKRAAGANPAYKKVIEENSRVIVKPSYVTVSLGG